MPQKKADVTMFRRGRGKAPTQNANQPSYASFAIAGWENEEAHKEEIERRLAPYIEATRALSRAMVTATLGTITILAVSVFAVLNSYVLEALLVHIILWIYPILWWERLPVRLRNFVDLHYNQRLLAVWLKVSETKIPNATRNPYSYRRQLEEIETLVEDINLLLDGRHPS